MDFILSHLSTTICPSVHIDIGNESSNVLMNGRAESKDFWTLSDDNANITTYMSELNKIPFYFLGCKIAHFPYCIRSFVCLHSIPDENVFMLTFSDTDSIEDIWLSQNITLSQNTSTISIRYECPVSRN